MPKVSMLLSCKDAEKTIEECIESILSQTFKDFNLFIFDDFSTDSTVSKILSFRDKRITIIKSSKNIGTYASKNFMLKNFVNSEFVALHDADDISDPDRLKRQVEVLEKNKSISCLGTAVLEFWEDNSTTPHTHSSNISLDRKRENLYPEEISRDVLSEVHETLTDKNRYHEYLEKKFCMNGTVMFRKETLDKLGGWDGSTMIAGDTEIFLRSLSIGNIKNISDVLYKRRFHENSLTSSKNVGIKSGIRKNYNLSLADIVKKSMNSIVKRDFYHPEFDFEVLNCAD